MVVAAFGHQTCDDSVFLLSPVLQMKVHGRVQVNVCNIQELCVENAGHVGLSHVEGVGGVGWCQVQPLHSLPRRLTEGHADHPLDLRDGGHLVAKRRQRGVHHISVCQKFVLMQMMRVAVVVLGAVTVSISVPFIFLASVTFHHFAHVSCPTDGIAKQRLQVALSVVVGCVVVRELDGRVVVIVPVEPRDEHAGTPWGHSNVRHNFGYRDLLPFFSGISGHLLKGKRVTEVMALNYNVSSENQIT